MNTQKSWFNAFFAWIHQEVDASVLEAYQRAGNVVFDLILEAELQRQQELTPWTTPLHLQIQNVCLWNALVLQTLGDQLLNTDYRLNPRTAGYVPPLTAKQIELFYQPVESWLSHAYQAKKNPFYTLDDLGLTIPTALPAWLTLKEMLNHHHSNQEITRYLDGLLTAAKTLALHIDTQIQSFAIEADNEQQVMVNKLHQLRANVSTTLEYVIQLWGEELHEGLHHKIEQGIRRIINAVTLLGQLLAMPTLINQMNFQQWNHDNTDTTDQATDLQQTTTPTKLTTSARPALAKPSSNSVNMWCLSAPSIPTQKANDVKACILMTTMWKNDPSPQQTLRIQKELEHALAQGHIDYASHQQKDHFKQCPWSAIYITRRPIIINGDPLRVRQLFTYVCDADRAYDLEPRSFGNRILRL